MPLSEILSKFQFQWSIINSAAQMAFWVMRSYTTLSDTLIGPLLATSESAMAWSPNPEWPGFVEKKHIFSEILEVIDNKV